MRTHFNPTSISTPSLGAIPDSGDTWFRVWAPRYERVEVEIYAPGYAVGRWEVSRILEMQPEPEGYFVTYGEGLKEGALYRFRLDERDVFPDPASRFQPYGVHGPSSVVNPRSFEWNDADWQGIAAGNLVFYELHVGTFSPEGDFEGVRKRLPYLRDLGITAIELMPLADFPGRWNWGYDQAALFAPASAYGTPDDLRRLVDTAHVEGLAVYLDAIYNHFGPDAAYAAAFGHYFTDAHETPWGQAINLDGEQSEPVRRFFLENAAHWLLEYHFDGLRLDATHALIDTSPRHFLKDLADMVKGLPGPERLLFAEDHRNLRTLIDPPKEGGYGLDGVWADDFHHQIRNLVAGDRHGYFADFAETTTGQLARTLTQGWFFSGQHSANMKKNRGTDPAGLPLHQFVIAIQNHDQIGNRAYGDRLHHGIEPAAYRAATAVLLFAPETPLLFMGQEWATSSPFQFFTDHHDELGVLVSEGRKREFEAFEDFKGAVPDPQDESTFQRSKLVWEEMEQPLHAGTLRLYQRLLAIRRDVTGRFTAEGSPEGGLSMRRGLYTLLVAFRPGIVLPVPAAARLVMHTEQPEFAPDGRAPSIHEGNVEFHTPAAALFIEEQAW